jgi:rare lipoprotein A
MSLTGFGLAQTEGDSLFIQKGTTSYYGKKFHGRRTSSGELFHVDSMTAAHKTLPFGTIVQVTRHDNGNFVLVRINDRLPSYSKRTIDISKKAAEELEMISLGLVEVDIEAASPEEMDRLIEYFKDREDPGLRLRPVYRPIRFEKTIMKWPLASLDAARLKPTF